MTEDSNSILREAQLINNDLGRHSVKCNFSTRLSGRFYQNCSLERHTMRRSRLSEMQSKRRRLEKELVLEKRRVGLLSDRLVDMENAREFALDMIFAIQRGVLGFQALVRRWQAMELLESMKHRVRMREMIALFCQSRYRGWKGRLHAASTREYLRQQLMNKSATTIQAFVRCHIQRKAYLDMLLERQILRDGSAVTIQAAFRGYRMQRMYYEEMKRRHEAALNVQRTFRGMKGRRIAKMLREEELARLRAEAEEKPKRIPLHMRRYSTYSVNANESHSQQRRNSILTRRRGSIDLTKTYQSSFNSANSSIDTRVDADENDSIAATTLTSLTNHTEISRKPVRPAVRSNNRKKPRHFQAAAKSSQSPSMKRRSTYSEGHIQPVSRTPNREKRKSLRSYATGDSRVNNEVSKSGRRSSFASQPHPIREVHTPISITFEACSIAEEVKSLATTPSPTESGENKTRTLTIPEAAAAFVKDVIEESLITYNIKSALINNDDDFREEEEDLSFLT